MAGAVLVAIAASMGNLLHGWDTAAIAATILYIKKEFEFQNEPAIEGLIVATSLVGATIVTTFCGVLSDRVGRRPMLIASSVLYFVGGLLVLWSPGIYMFLIARLVAGFGTGLAVMLVPVYISETAPSDIRGRLNALPQFTGLVGVVLSYFLLFAMSLKLNPEWRIMLGILPVPSLLYFALTIFYLPESPRWLVGRGRMEEARRALQLIRGKEDVSGEMALLVEGLVVGEEISVQEYIIGPADAFIDENGPLDDSENITLYPEAGLSWVARPVEQRSIMGSALALFSNGGAVNQSSSLIDPVVKLFASVHEKAPEMGSMRSTLFPNFGSMFNVVEPDQKAEEEWDEEESIRRDDEDYDAADVADDVDPDDLENPLISRQTTTLEEKDMGAPADSIMSMQRRSSIFQGRYGEAVSSMGIGGGWQLAWKWAQRNSNDGGDFKRIYLRPENLIGFETGSVVSNPATEAAEAGELVHAVAIISKPALYTEELVEQSPLGPAMTHPRETRGLQRSGLSEPGVKQALLIGVGLQMLQQFAGVNGVLYYSPQILHKVGIDSLLADVGIGSDALSILVSAFVALLMLPSVGVALRLMDFSGRRLLLLTTTPILVVPLLLLIVVNVVTITSTVCTALSAISVALYLCFFVMGFGSVPNILCAEIFPMRVRGTCMALCMLSFWVSNFLITSTLPIALRHIGLPGVFGIYTVFCILAFLFSFLKVPETKCMPLEVIAEFFSVGAKRRTPAT